MEAIFGTFHYTILGLLSTCGLGVLPFWSCLDYGYTYRTPLPSKTLLTAVLKKSGKAGP